MYGALVACLLWCGLLHCAPATKHGVCTALEGQQCADQRKELAVGDACEPACEPGSAPLGPLVCAHGSSKSSGPGCIPLASLPEVEASDIDAVPDATNASDMVFHGFKMVNFSSCLIYPALPTKVKSFIRTQAGKYGPSASAIKALTKLGTPEKTEFFLSIEQISVLLAQLLCGANGVAHEHGPVDKEKEASHPQSYAFGRAMEHWFSDDTGSPRDWKWRRTTLVAYGTFDSDRTIPNVSSSVSTGSDLHIVSGCGAHHVADWGLADRSTLTVVFAGHYVGGWMTAWHHPNLYGAQEEKFGTLVPEMMLATEPLRMMGAGLLSNGNENPWLPMAGWYIIGAGTYAQSRGYPFWTPEKVPLKDSEDYFSVGSGRRMRKRGLVAILAKPCNDRGHCFDNTDDDQYRCYNRQVMDNDIGPASLGGAGANLWGIAAGAFNFQHWPAKTREMLQAQHVEKNWVLQAGGWGAGAFGCGTLYNGLVQALAAKKGGWAQMRMCYATKDEPHPTIQSKLNYAVARPSDLKAAKVLNAEAYKPLLEFMGDEKEIARDNRHHDVSNDYHQSGAPGHGHLAGPTSGILFADSQFGAVAAQLQTKIEQHVVLPKCKSDGDAPHIKCNIHPDQTGDCYSSMKHCCDWPQCEWHKDKSESLLDYAGRSCSRNCMAVKGICAQEDIPEKCRVAPEALKSHSPHSKGGSNHPSAAPAWHSHRARDFNSYEAEAEDTAQSQFEYAETGSAAQDGYGEADSEYLMFGSDQQELSFVDEPHPPAGLHWYVLALVVGGFFLVSGFALLFAPATCFASGRSAPAWRQLRTSPDDGSPECRSLTCPASEETEEE